MELPTEISKQWVNEVKKYTEMIKDNQQLKMREYMRITKEFNWTDMKTKLQHTCGSDNVIGKRNYLRHKSGTDSSTPILLTAIFHCKKCSMVFKVNLRDDGSIVFGKPSMLIEEPSMPITNEIAHSKLSYIAKQFTSSIDLDPFYEAENPVKYPDDPARVESVLTNHPGLTMENLIINAEKMGKSFERNGKTVYSVQKLLPSKDTIYINSILPIIKQHSGCEVNLKLHFTSRSLFSTLRPHHKLGTFKFNCRSQGQCGVKYITNNDGGITVTVYGNKTAKFNFSSQRETTDGRFLVMHDKMMGAIPR